MTVHTLSEVEAIIAERIVAGPAFRESFPDDPRAVLSEVIEFDIPESVQVVLHEESLTQIHLTLPESDALTDDDLESSLAASTSPGAADTAPPAASLSRGDHSPSTLDFESSP